MISIQPGPKGPASLDLSMEISLRANNGDLDRKKNMKITLFQTAESLDPNAITENPKASLAGYIKEVSAALEKAFPGLEIGHQEMDTPRSWKLEDLTVEQEAERHEIEREMQDIMETVFQQGTFWE